MLDVCLLGTGGMMPLPHRWLTALMTRYNGSNLLIDCGEGVQIQMRRMGISYLKIEAICISHIHGDHLFGLFGLLSTMGMLGRTAKLRIFAPRSFAPILKFYISYFGDGMKFDIDFQPLSMKSPEVIYETKSIEILAFPLNHRIETFGYVIREKPPMFNVHKDAIERYGLSLAEIGTLKRGEDVVRNTGVISNSEAAYLPYVPRSYAYCSDTAPFPELAQWVKGVDLLYHESTFPVSMSDMAAATFHSTTLQAAECAREAGAARLVVGHYSSRFSNVVPFLDEIRQVFDNAVLAKEGDVLEIPLVRTGR